MTETIQKGTLVSNGSACLFGFAAYWSTKNLKQHPVKKRKSPLKKPRYSRHFQRCIVAFILVGVARLELAASCSQSRRATNCATPRHLAARLHRQNIVYRFLCGSSIRNPQLTALHGLLFSTGRSGSWQQRKRARQQALFMATGCGFGATDKKRMKKLDRTQNLLRSSCKLAGKVLS